MRQHGARRKIVKHTSGAVVMECGHKKTYKAYRPIPKRYAWCLDCKSRWDKADEPWWPE